MPLETSGATTFRLYLDGFDAYVLRLAEAWNRQLFGGSPGDALVTPWIGRQNLDGRIIQDEAIQQALAAAKVVRCRFTERTRLPRSPNVAMEADEVIFLMGDLDRWFRIAGMGQMYQHCLDAPMETLREIQQLLLGSPSGNFGAANHAIPLAYRRGVEIHDALRYKHAWTMNPPKPGQMLLAAYDEPMALTRLDPVVVEVVDG